MEGQPEAKRRRVEPKKQSTLFAFGRLATPQNSTDADEEGAKEAKAEWLPRLGEAWCTALLPELRCLDKLEFIGQERSKQRPRFSESPQKRLQLILLSSALLACILLSPGGLQCTRP